jgi:dipeptidyl aminopeptidase/acylaminoacyl peptidase
MRGALRVAAALALAPAGFGQEPVSFHRDVRPLLQRSCQGCHQPARSKGKLDLTDFAGLMAGGRSGPALDAGEPDESFLVELVTSLDGEPPEMPEGGPALTEDERLLLVRWILDGAHDDSPAASGPRFSPDRPPIYPRPPVITSLDYSPDGTLLAVSGHHEVLVHTSDGAELVTRLVGLSERIESIAFSPDGKRLAVGAGSPGQMGELQIWSVAPYGLLHSIPLTHDTIYGVSWSPDGTLVAAGCTDNAVRCVDASTGELVLFQRAHEDWVLGTAFSLDSTHLVSVGRDRSLRLIKVATQQFIDNITSITPGALKGGLMAVARHPERDELLVGGADGTPKVYRMYREKKRVIGDDFNQIRAFGKLPGRVFDVAWSPDGAFVAAVSSAREGGASRGGLRVEQAADAQMVWDSEVPAGLYTLAFHPDGSVLAVGGEEGVVRLHDVRSGKVMGAFSPVPPAAPVSHVEGAR